VKKRIEELAKELGYDVETVMRLRVLDVAALLELRRAMRAGVAT
jgi:hypothetical protein